MHNHTSLDHHSSRPSGHAHSPHASSSRRDFFRVLMGGALAGASALELGYHRAAWARAAVDPGSQLFDIEKAAEGVYFAAARPQVRINCNAAIFVGSKDVVVVDTHARPSAATSLLGQIKREITEKPVRYVVNTHFHGDHIQGNQAYRAAESKLDFIASATTKQLMSDLAVARVKEALASVPKQVEEIQARAAKASSAEEKAYCADEVRQLEGYQAELQNFTLELPTITFDKTYVLHDSAHDLHLEFHGHAHTAGDIVVFCPQKRVVTTGDMIIGLMPNMSDGFPRIWPGTIKSVSQLEFTKVLPGHGAIQEGRTAMLNLANYIEELTTRVAEGKKAGLTVDELQKRITVASLKSLQSNGYADYVISNLSRYTANFGERPSLQQGVNWNISAVYNNLDRV
jgi:glyoxylase-like metal-dependent hydrolase (beta-lactamase superfamily II)